jgi:hypothetical protein
LIVAWAAGRRRSYHFDRSVVANQVELLNGKG